MVNRMVDGPFVLTNDVYEHAQRFYLHAPKVEVSCRTDSVVLSSTEPMRVLSSGLVGGGWVIAQHVVNLMVHPGYASSDPLADVDHRLGQLGISKESSVALMTAVRMQDTAFCMAEFTGGSLVVCATAGFANAAHVLDIHENALPTVGTVNIIVFVAADLSPSAQVGSLITVTEAKAATLAALQVPSRTGRHMATGTTSDAVAIGVIPTLDGDGGRPKIEYAGLATSYGRALSKAVYTSICISGLRYFLRTGRPLPTITEEVRPFLTPTCLIPSEGDKA